MLYCLLVLQSQPRDDGWHLFSANVNGIPTTMHLYWHMENNSSAQVSLQAQPANSSHACWHPIQPGCPLWLVVMDKIPALRSYSKFWFPESKKNKLTISLFLLEGGINYRCCNVASMHSLCLGEKDRWLCHERTIRQLYLLNIKKT